MAQKSDPNIGLTGWKHQPERGGGYYSILPDGQEPLIHDDPRAAWPNALNMSAQTARPLKNLARTAEGASQGPPG